MAITIDFMSGSLKQGANMKMPDQHIHFIKSIFPTKFNSKIIFEKDDTNAWTNIYFYNPSLSIDDVSCWEELEVYAAAKEIYINVYDHKTKETKSFIYDEDEVWIDMETKLDEDYEVNAP